MSDSDKAKFPKPSLVLEMATLHTFSPVKGRDNKEGDEVEEPMISLAFRVPADMVGRYMNLITSLWRKKRAVTIGLVFVEQLELLARRSAADQDGSDGPAPGGLTPITGGKAPKKKRETAKT